MPCEPVDRQRLGQAQHPPLLLDDTGMGCQVADRTVDGGGATDLRTINCVGKV